MAVIGKTKGRDQGSVVREHRSRNLRRQQIGDRLAAADQAGVVAFYQHLGGAEAGVVVGALRHAVGARVEQSDQIAGLDGGELAIAGEEVAGLADRADDIDDSGAAGLLGALERSRGAPGRARGG